MAPSLLWSRLLKTFLPRTLRTCLPWMLLLLSFFQFLIFMYPVLFSDNSKCPFVFWASLYTLCLLWVFIYSLFIVSVALCLVSLFEFAFVMHWFLIYPPALASLGTYGCLSTLEVRLGRNLETKHMSVSLVVCLLVRPGLGVDFIDQGPRYYPRLSVLPHK